MGIGLLIQDGDSYRVLKRTHLIYIMARRKKDQMWIVSPKDDLFAAEVLYSISYTSTRPTILSIYEAFSADQLDRIRAVLEEWQEDVASGTFCFEALDDGCDDLGKALWYLQRVDLIQFSGDRVIPNPLKEQEVESFLRETGVWEWD